MVKIYKVIYSIGLMTSFSANALIVSLEDSTNGNLNQFALATDGKIYSNTNKFNFLKEKAIGDFDISNIKSLKSEFDKLKRVNTYLSDIEKKLQTRKQSFNNIHTYKPHESYVKVGSFKIPQSHEYYKDIVLSMRAITKKVKLSYKRVLKLNTKSIHSFMYYKNNKLIKTQPISTMAHCEKNGSNEICRDKSYGSFYL
jgi:hypothetical protein